MPHHSTHPTRPRAALHEPSRARSAPCTQLPMPSPADSSTLRTATSAFTQHNLHSHRTSPRLCASPPPGLCPPTPARGSAPPPPSRRPALPVNLCAICSAHNNVLTLRARSQRLGHSCTCPASRAQRVGSRTFTRIAWVPAFLCRVTQAASAHITGWQQSTAAHC